MQGDPPGVMETSSIPPLAPARSRHHKACGTSQRPSHPQLPQCRLRQRPLPCGQQGTNNTQYLSTASLVGRPLGVTASRLKSLRSGNQHYSNPCTNSSASAGDKDTSPRTCVMQTLSPCTRTKKTTVTVTTTVAYPCSASLERLLNVLPWRACRP
ncbi:uncharacterized [Tachysurus ichikawai]